MKKFYLENLRRFLFRKFWYQIYPVNNELWVMVTFWGDRRSPIPNLNQTVQKALFSLVSNASGIRDNRSCRRSIIYLFAKNIGEN